eukprot:TRINITY_DN2966_c0_g1_i1.p1 TRINITY_DN2966_c0_g1~~TRINITY_DN2966_c0_g1_i1.p1  ORF type:complete len:149 (+),score=17.57 TRINITY_DN2966_c0_g1_i1:61-447(+)
MCIRDRCRSMVSQSATSFTNPSSRDLALPPLINSANFDNLCNNTIRLIIAKLNILVLWLDLTTKNIEFQISDFFTAFSNAQTSHLILEIGVMIAVGTISLFFSYVLITHLKAALRKYSQSQSLLLWTL